MEGGGGEHLVEGGGGEHLVEGGGGEQGRGYSENSSICAGLF